MAKRNTKTRLDSCGRILRKGEYECANGYRYRITDDKTGKSRYIYAKDLTALRRRIKELDSSDTITAASARRMTLADAFAAWYADAMVQSIEQGELAKIRPHVLQHYKTWWQEMMAGHRLGDIRLHRLEQADITEYYRYLLKPADSGGGGYSFDTVRQMHYRVKVILDYAAARLWCPERLADGAWRALDLKAPKRAYRALTVVQRDALIDALGDEPYYSYYKPLVKFLLYTGLRVGEAAALTPDDVTDTHISVTKTAVNIYNPDTKQCEWLINPPKTSAGVRRFAMLAESKEALDEWAALKHTTATLPDGRDTIWCTRGGKLLQGNNLSKVLHKVAARANANANEIVIPDAVTCHWLRHTFCCDLIDDGVRVTTVAAIMGHKDISVTTQVYYDCRDATVDDEIAARNAKRKTIN